MEAATFSQLPARFRARAADLQPYAPPAAVAWEEAAKLLEEALAVHQDEYLTPEEAEQESGYTAKHLARLVREEVIPAAPDGRIMRRHLPRKPGFGVSAPPARPALSIASTRVQPAPSRAQVARAVVDHRKV